MIRTRRVFVGCGLSRADALKKALRKSPGDFRGFTYNPRTGYASLT